MVSEASARTDAPLWNSRYGEDAFGLIYTEEDNHRLGDLTLSRAVAAVPFGGRYRCIDFILSDMVNSGIHCVGVITQKNYHSLMDHLGSGKEWDLHRKREGLFIIPPFQTRENTGIYRGSVDAFRAAIGYVKRSPQRYLLLSGSHTIYNMVFSDMLDRHISSGADVTLLYYEDPMMDPEDARADLRFDVGADGYLTNVRMDPHAPFNGLHSGEALIMDKKLFIETVDAAYARGDVNYVRDVLVRFADRWKVLGYRFDGYVANVTSTYSYFAKSMELLDEDVRRELFDPKHPVYTKVKDETSARYGSHARVKNALLADGCVIDGRVEDSILFRGVKIGRGAKVRNCVLMQGARIGEDCVLEHVIVDKGAKISDGRTLTGYDSFPVIVRKNLEV